MVAWAALWGRSLSHAAEQAAGGGGGQLAAEAAAPLHSPALALPLAGFVGYDEFGLLRSATLLVVHTFGAMLLVALALPLVLRSLAGAAGAAAAGAAARPARAGPEQQQEQQRQEQSLVQQEAEQPLPDGWWQRALLAFLLVRACTAFAATVGAAVQRRHLYAWALFAPKFAFELCFLLGTDLLMALLCLLL